jgi:PTH1 family peptidyl-tRNA hydrolase
MKLIAGLGNPGDEYKNTRHNVGFDTIDKLADSLGVSITSEAFHGLYTFVNIGEEKVLLLKPMTFMNKSGISVREAANYFKIENGDIFVIYDDMDIEPGKIKLKEHGESAGHNGIKSIISELKTDSFKRVRIGTGRPTYDVVDYVLSKPSKEDAEAIYEAENMAVLAIKLAIKEGFPKAMSLYNLKG